MTHKTRFAIVGALLLLASCSDTPVRAVAAGDSIWTDLGSVDSLHVYRRCDAHVTVYVARDEVGHAMALSTLMQGGPCQ